MEATGGRCHKGTVLLESVTLVRLGHHGGGIGNNVSLKVLDQGRRDEQSKSSCMTVQVMLSLRNEGGILKSLGSSASSWT